MFVQEKPQTVDLVTEVKEEDDIAPQTRSHALSVPSTNFKPAGAMKVDHCLFDRAQSSIAQLMSKGLAAVLAN